MPPQAARTSDTHPRFITDRALYEHYRKHFEPHESITARPPEHALFSLIPLDATARQVVLHSHNRHLARRIDYAQGCQVMGLTLIKPPNPNNLKMATIGGSADATIQIADLDSGLDSNIAPVHLAFALNVISAIPVVKDYAGKGNTSIGKESLNEEGQEVMSDICDLQIRGTATLLPMMNTMITLGPKDAPVCRFRTYWHVNTWTLNKPESRGMPLDKSLTPAQILENSADQVVNRNYKPTEKPKPPKQSTMHVHYLGNATYGSVVKAVDALNGNVFAVKRRLETESQLEQIKVRKLGRFEAHNFKKKAKEEFLNEILAMSNLTHDRIIRFHGWQDFGDHCEIFADLKEGSAEDFVVSKNLNPLARCRAAYDVLKDVTEGLICIHDHEFVVRNLCPANIYREKWKPAESGHRFVIGDLSSCVPVKSHEPTLPKTWNIAPELFEKTRAEHVTQADIWSLFATVMSIAMPNYFAYAVQSGNVADKIRDLTELPELAAFESIVCINPAERSNARQLYKKLANQVNKNAFLQLAQNPLVTGQSLEVPRRPKVNYRATEDNANNGHATKPAQIQQKLNSGFRTVEKDNHIVQSAGPSDVQQRLKVGYRAPEYDASQVHATGSVGAQQRFHGGYQAAENETNMSQGARQSDSQQKANGGYRPMENDTNVHQAASPSDAQQRIRLGHRAQEDDAMTTRGARPADPRQRQKLSYRPVENDANVMHTSRSIESQQRSRMNYRPVENDVNTVHAARPIDTQQRSKMAYRPVDNDADAMYTTKSTSAVNNQTKYPPTTKFTSRNVNGPDSEAFYPSRR